VSHIVTLRILSTGYHSGSGKRYLHLPIIFYPCLIITQSALKRVFNVRIPEGSGNEECTFATWPTRLEIEATQNLSVREGHASRVTLIGGVAMEARLAVWFFAAS
jgi:hypothetical protein